jgi:hypothetical protein
MLLDLENIEKVFVAKDGKKARSNKTAAGTAPKKAEIVPRKHKKGGSSGGPAPKKARTTKHCKWWKVAGRLHQTHDTSECRRFDKDGKEIGKPYKPFDFANKAWKKVVVTQDRWLIWPRNLRNLRRNSRNPRRPLRNVRMTCRIVIPTVNRIVGTVARAIT